MMTASALFRRDAAASELELIGAMSVMEKLLESMQIKVVRSLEDR
jgi:hypothetical protein